MKLLKINLISFESNKNLDIFSKNDIVVSIKYGDYNITTGIINNNNNPVFNKEYILQYTDNTNLIVSVYDTDFMFGDMELYKEIIFNLDTKRYCNNELKYYFEIIYNEYDFLNLQNCFNTLYNNVNKIKDNNTHYK
mgnify:CR=1 FL=1|tara:strand:+ start:139 stop:546 length:408 start_codon:yes stop_codon:yes gene_type:complete